MAPLTNNPEKTEGPSMTTETATGYRRWTTSEIILGKSLILSQSKASTQRKQKALFIGFNYYLCTRWRGEEQSASKPNKESLVYLFGFFFLLLSSFFFNHPFMAATNGYFHEILFNCECNNQSADY